MGDEPIKDADTIIRNPDFVDASEWLPVGSWTIGGLKASYTCLAVPAGSLTQLKVGGVNNYWYKVNFTLENASFNKPAGGLKILFNNTVYPTLYRTNGDFEAIFQGGVANEIFQLLTLNETVGDTVDVISCNIFPMVTYPQNVLGIDYPGPQRTEFAAAVGAEYQQILASRNGKTNLGILYNI